METNKDTAIKQALECRYAGHLSPESISKIMRQVRIEAEKRRKQKAMIDFMFLIAASSLLIVLAVYVLVFRMNIKLSDFTSQSNILGSSSIIIFYGYIALIVLALLFGDYLLRTISKKKS